MKIILISISEVTAITGYSADEIQELMKLQIYAFPLSISLDSGFVGWQESEVYEWANNDFRLKSLRRSTP
jgi:predicted DNA-binding transcriptional regulator AlpA